MVSVKKEISYITRLFFVIFFLIIFSQPLIVNAIDIKDTQNSELSSESIYNQQAEIIGTDKLFDGLPEETKELLAETGITDLEYDTVRNINIKNIFSKTVSIIGAQSRTPFGGIAACIGIMLLCAFMEGFNVTAGGEKPLKSVTGAVGSLSICTAMVIPVCSTIEKAVETMNNAAGFMFLYVPVMSGLMAASEKEIAAGSYYTSMMAAGEIIMQLSSKVIAPMMNVFLCLSVTSSFSPKMRLGTLCQEIYKIAKWILTFSMSIFVTILSVQTFISSSLDNVSKRALRFAVSSFVPVVGGVLSETINAFSGSMELLKSGAGVFVIIASGFLFLPVIAQCFIWQISIFLLGAASDIMGLDGVHSIYKTLSSVISMLLAVMVCILIIFIISTVIILLIAG